MIYYVAGKSGFIVGVNPLKWDRDVRMAKPFNDYHSAVSAGPTSEYFCVLEAITGVVEKGRLYYVATRFGFVCKANLRTSADVRFSKVYDTYDEAFKAGSRCAAKSNGTEIMKTNYEYPYMWWTILSPALK